MDISKSSTNVSYIFCNKLWKYYGICKSLPRFYFYIIILFVILLYFIYNYYIIFYNYILENSSEDIIQPNEFLLKKGETTTIEITIVMSPERLEMLIEQDSNSKIININKLSLIYGDEVSRVRISRLVYRVNIKIM